MRWFHTLESMEWSRVSLVVAAMTTFWAGLVSIVPERYHHVVTVVLAAFSSTVTLMMRSGKTPNEKEADEIRRQDMEAATALAKRQAEEAWALKLRQDEEAKRLLRLDDK
jgi:hypothetical protein